MLEKCVLTILELNWNQCFRDKKTKLKLYLLSHTTAKQVISRRGENENICEISTNEKCTCKACKNTVFRCQMYKFVTFLLPSSSWLLKLPDYSTDKPEVDSAHILLPLLQHYSVAPSIGAQSDWKFCLISLEGCSNITKMKQYLCNTLLTNLSCEMAFLTWGKNKTDVANKGIKLGIDFVLNVFPFHHSRLHCTKCGMEVKKAMENTMLCLPPTETRHKDQTRRLSSWKPKYEKRTCKMCSKWVNIFQAECFVLETQFVLFSISSVHNEVLIGWRSSPMWSTSLLLQYRSKNYVSAVFTSWLVHKAWENVLPAILFCFHMCDVCCVAFESPIGGIKLLSQALE